MVAQLILLAISLLLLIIIPNKKTGLKWAFCAITIFLAIRYDWGNDYQGYLDAFQRYNNYGLKIFDINQSGSATTHEEEYGWIILNRIFGFIGVGFFGFVIFIALFENWLIYRFVSKYMDPRYYWVAILLLIFTSAFCINASMMRQYLCMCLYLVVIELMCDKKIKGYFLWSIGIILLGTTFHRSNIALLITLPLYYLRFKEEKFNWWWVSAIVIVYFVWSFASTTLIENSIMNLLEQDESYEYYSNYIEGSANKETHFGPYQLFRIIMFIVWLWMLPQVERNKQPIVLLGIFSYFFEPIVTVVPMASRFVSYITLTDMIRWSILLMIAKNRQPLLYLLFFYLLYNRYSTFSQFYYDPNWIQKCLNYHTIFEASTWM